MNIELKINKYGIFRRTYTYRYIYLILMLGHKCNLIMSNLYKKEKKLFDIVQFLQSVY